MRALAEPMPSTALRRVLRVPQQPYLRFDTNDYSLHPRFAGRRVELRASQRQILGRRSGRRSKSTLDSPPGDILH